jgi:hypothetical protein
MSRGSFSRCGLSRAKNLEVAPLARGGAVMVQVSLLEGEPGGCAGAET